MNMWVMKTINYKLHKFERSYPTWYDRDKCKYLT